MNRRDLSELEQSIYSLGKTISEQEHFYRDINGFLDRVYPPQRDTPLSPEARPKVSTLKKNYWRASSADGQMSRTSVPNP